MPVNKVIVAVRDPEVRERILGAVSRDFPADAVTTTANGLELAKLLEERRPTVLFASTDLDRVSVFQIIEGLTPRRIPAIVFVAPDGAIATDIAASGWTRLAPEASATAIRAAVESARSHPRSASTHSALGNLSRRRVDALGRIDHICVRFGIRPKFIPLPTVQWIESCGNYVRLHTADPEAWKVRVTLNRLEKLLDPQQFVRIHRCHVVNADHVMDVQPHFHGDAKVVMRNGDRIELSRTHRAALAALDVTA